MRVDIRTYVSLVALHIAIGMLLYFVPFAGKLYAYILFLGGLIYIVRKQNKNHEALCVAAYITGAEVLLRSTDSLPLYEFAKYSVVAIIGFGMFFSGFSRNAIAYGVYLLLLVPGIIISVFVLDASIEDRKLISFVISGPVQLGLVSLYTYQRKISVDNFHRILLCMGLPIIAHTAFLIFYTPDIREVLTGTDSNAEAAGGFGPNQVSTVIGLGVFIFVSRAILRSPNLALLALNIILATIMAYRGIITFSRGGIYTAIVMIVLLLLGIYFRFNFAVKRKIHFFMGGVVLLSMAIWSYSVLQTEGLIGKRYANQDASGRVKESRLTGREDLIRSEWDAFYDNPIVGVGVGKSIEIREKATGINSASHNEITRLLGEHGALGIMALLILFATPWFLHLDNKVNFFMLPLLFFWLLTINHAAMRIAAPAFVYSLCLLKVQFPQAARKKKGPAYPGMIKAMPQ